MESRPKKLSVVFALLIAGFWIFAFKYLGVSIYLQAPAIHGNLKPGTASSTIDNEVFEFPKRHSTAATVTDNVVFESPKRDKNSKSISRRRLSFCYHASNTESKGETPTLNLKSFIEYISI